MGIGAMYKIRQMRDLISRKPGFHVGAMLVRNSSKPWKPGVSKKEVDHAEILEMQELVLGGIARMPEEVQVEVLGALMTDDEDDAGYYVVEWLSEPYTLQEEI